MKPDRYRLAGAGEAEHLRGGLPGWQVQPPAAAQGGPAAHLPLHPHGPG
jgi:hypothetical protein